MTTTTSGESAEEIPTEEAVTRLRFRLDGLKDRAKRIWAAVHGHDPDRGPEDYPPWDDERRILVDIIRKQTGAAGGGNYNEGDSSTKAVVIGVGIALLSAFILGGWVLSNKVAGLEATVTEWKAAVQRQLDANSQRIDRLENRRP